MENIQFEDIDFNATNRSSNRTCSKCKNTKTILLLIMLKHSIKSLHYNYNYNYVKNKNIKSYLFLFGYINHVTVYLQKLSTGFDILMATSKLF